MSIDISKVFQPYGINFTKLEEDRLPKSGNFTWINVNDIPFIKQMNKRAEGFMFIDPVAAADTITQMIEETAVEFHTQVLNEAFSRSEHQTEELWHKLITDINALKTAGKFIMLDNYKNPKVNKLIMDWGYERGFCIMYPSYLYEPDLALYVMKQTSPFAELIKSNPRYS